MTKLMKSLMLAFIASTLFAITLTAQENPEKPKFTVTIRIENPVIAANSDVDIWITTTNISDKLIRVQFGEHGNLPDGFHYEVRDEQGAEVAKTVYNDIRPSRGPGSGGSRQLAPRESQESRARISDVYPLDRPGKYTIRAWIRAVDVLDDSESNRVYSNTITITVADPQKPSDNQQ